MFILLKLLAACLLIEEIYSARRCQISSNFERQCGTHSNYYGLTPKQCREKCEEDNTCLNGHWHPPHQIWDDESRTVCFLFKTNDANLKPCENGGIETLLGAKMIRCSAKENVEIERCWMSADFQRHCGSALRYVYGESPDKCRQICNDRKDCYVGHWHPPYTIWDDEPRSVCFIFPYGTEVCNWGGAELIGYHQGAHMIRCRQGLREYEEDDEDD